MASRVNVNALTVVHAGSDGIAPAFPDICLTPAPPGPPIPVPYPNLAKSADTAQGTKSVVVEGNPVMVQDAVFSTSTGDETGSAGGVASATTKGKARFVNYSFDVKLDGKCVARLGDPMTHNELAAANTAPFPEIQPPCSMVPSVPSGDDQVDEVSQTASLPVQSEPAYVFVWDQVNERQWVNLPATWGTDCGRRVTLVGHVEPRASGRKVGFTLQADPANPPRHALAELASATARSDGDGAVKIDVQLPIYGGARFQVSARAVGGPHVISPPITVWRRIFYQLTTMDPAPDGRRFDPPSGLMDVVRDHLAAVFIDLQPGTVASATTPYLVNVGTPDDSAATAKAGIRDVRSPFKLHIVAIDNAESRGRKKEKIYTSAQIETKPFLKWKYGETITPARATFTTQEEPDTSRLLVDVQVLDTFDGKAIITARVPHPHPWKVMVRLDYWVQAGPTPAGWGGTDGVLRICVGDVKTRYREHEVLPVLAHVMIHEIGHALGLVPEEASWHDPDPRDEHYKPKHCRHLNADGSPECVMWFKGRRDGIGHYCTSHEPHNCSHYLRAADLSKVAWI
jgi:hypothetical protein